MELNLDPGTATYRINNHELGKITVSGISYTDSIIVMPEKLLPWGIHNISNITSKDIAELCCYRNDIVVIGTGNICRQLPPELQVEFTRKKIGIEVMTTEAACRTYNVLMAERRNVLAALIVENKNEQ